MASVNPLYWIISEDVNALPSTVTNSLTVDKRFFQNYLNNKTCALVGSSGILKQTTFGAEIDSNDVVVRYGVPRLVSQISGTKTDVLFLNPSAFTTYVDVLDSLISMKPTFIAINCAEISCYGLARAVKKSLAAESVRVVVADCNYFIHARRVLKEAYGWNSTGSAPRTGQLFAFPFLQECATVTFYGQWPWDRDCMGKSIPYHYWEHIAGETTRRVHDASSDFSALRRMIESSNTRQCDCRPLAVADFGKVTFTRHGTHKSGVSRNESNSRIGQQCIEDLLKVRSVEG
jgi:hypothetical protein